MNELSQLLSGVLALPQDRVNPMRLFLDADIVVQLVMAGLLLASVWVWMIIISFSLRMGRVQRRCAAYEADFWAKAEGRDIADLKARGENPAARVVSAGLHEVELSKGRPGSALLERIARGMESQVAEEADNLAERLNFLATVGAVAPFVGLFGTVWGIMNSFFQIGEQQNSSLAVVAPGISEALFATAIGLFAAIPAVIAYNRLSHRVNAFEARLQRLADRFHSMISREVDAG
ncbi:MAG: protein TolQ [Novosphingobium sp.]|nr:protein TolQ [Novosphingobium sp.]